MSVELEDTAEFEWRKDSEKSRPVTNTLLSRWAVISQEQMTEWGDSASQTGLAPLRRDVNQS